MKLIRQIFVLLIVAGLTACGADKPGSAGAALGSSPSKAAPRPGNASAEQVAREARGAVNCPARVQTGARDAKAPVDDVLGVRPGMSYEDAANVVMCSHELMIV